MESNKNDDATKELVEKWEAISDKTKMKTGVVEAGKDIVEEEKKDKQD